MANRPADLTLHLVLKFLLIAIFTWQPLQAVEQAAQAPAVSPEPPASPAIPLTQEEKAWLKQNPVLRIAPDPDYPPMEFVDSQGQYQGLAADYLRLMAQQLGLQIEIVKTENFSQALELVRRGDADLVGTNIPTDELREEFLFGDIPYTKHYDAIITRTNISGEVKLGDLSGKTVVVTQDWTAEIEYIESNYPDINVVGVADSLEGLTRVALSEYDYFITSMATASYLSREHGLTGLRIAGVFGDKPAADTWTVRKDATMLHQLLQKAMNRITPKQKSAIRARWISNLGAADTEQPQPLRLTEEEQNWLKQHPIIKVVLDPEWAPVEYLDERGKYLGISIDYLDTLENILGIEFQIQNGLSWQQAVEAVKEKRADMFASVSKTPQREAYLAFTKPYISMPIRIFAKDDVSYFGNIDNLRNKSVTVVEGYAIHDWLKNEHPDLLLNTVKTPADGLSRLAGGDTDAFIGNVVIANYYLGKLNFHNIKAAGDTHYSNDQAMAVRDDWPILAQILDKALATIPNQRKELIFNRWMSIQFEHAINYQLVWQITAAALGLLLLILYWNRKLAREVTWRKRVEAENQNYQLLLEQRVDQRTLALKESESKFRQVLESTAEGIFGTNHRGEATLVNPTASRLLGYEAEELIGKPLHQLLHHSHVDGKPYPVTECPIHATLMDGQPRHVDNEVLWRKDGTSFPVEYRCMPIIQDSDTVGVVVSFSDITKRKESEEKLLSEQNRTRDIILGTNAGTWDWTIPTDELRVNTRWAEIIGYTPEEVKPLTSESWLGYLHPDDREQVVIQMKRHLNDEVDYYDVEFRQQHKDGHWVWINSRGKIAERDAEGKPLRMSGTHLDITGRKEAEEQLLRQAHFDTLTGLPNRFLSLDRLNQMIIDASRHNEKIAVLFLDLDDFKKVNDTMGHDVGDEVLIEASKRLGSTLRDGDTVGRLGGDEFIVLINDIEDASDISPVAEKLLQSFQSAFRTKGRDLVLTASVGISIYPDDGTTASKLLRNADSAMYHSKDSGRNTYSYFTDAMNRENARRLLLEEQMHGALERQEFRLFYQPKFDIQSQKVIGVEALLRWTNPMLGAIAPDEFIPLAEHTGLIIPIGQFVLEQALQQAKTWQQQGHQLSIAVNLSPRQFRDPNLTQQINRILQQYEIEPEQLELEITEGLLMSGHSFVDNCLSALNEMGIGLAMDDFGTGYSSLSYLRRYPFDILKVDRSFIADIVDDEKHLKLVQTSIAMAHGLGLKVVAEGVETKDQLVLLKQMDCDIAQGYLISKPVPEDEILELLKQPFDFMPVD